MKKGKGWADHYTRRARDENWRARSVFKLEEIDRKYKLLLPGRRLLDLGCFPGSWSQYGLKCVGTNGKVIGVDLEEPLKIQAPQFQFIEADVFKLDPIWLRDHIGPMDVVISDLAPQTTGIRITDTARSIALATRALQLAAAMLNKGGHFLCKVFEGDDLKVLKGRTTEHFKQIRLMRPAAVRKKSREIYLIGLKFDPSSM
ncbi:SAM-dependent methyltransferase [Thermodesulfobacteriota bacterium]